MQNRMVPLEFPYFLGTLFSESPENCGGSAVGESASSPHFTLLNFTEGESI